jgi:hypothetical protein
VLRDGMRTTVTLARFPAISFKEKTVTPPGFDGGDAIEQTTMFNEDVRTKWPRQLFEMTDASATVAYDPGVFGQIRQCINIPDTITVTYPDGTTQAAWGYLQKFEPGELQEGEQPEADVTFVFMNQDEDGVEQYPVIAEVTGT